MTENNKKVAIVTGASRGIGSAIAERLAIDGLAIIVNYSGSAEAAGEVVKTIRERGGDAEAIQANVSDPAAFRLLFDEAQRLFGGADVLVNNAGLMRLSPLAKADDEVFDQLIDINLRGVFNGLREGANRLRNGGRIINLSSTVVGLYQPTYGIYAATKAAVEAMTHVLAKELGSRAITVNAVAPGPVATELFFQGKDQALIDRITQSIPLGRLGQLDDIASVVSLIASKDSGWINGQVIRANGGVI